MKLFCCFIFFLSIIAISSSSFTSSPITCDVCQYIIDIVSSLDKKGFDHTIIEDVAIEICIKKEIEKEDVCTGIIKTYAPEFIELIKNVHNTDYICFILQFCNISDPGLQNNVSNVKTSLNKVLPPSVNSGERSEMGTMFHISDLHVDQSYKAGTNTDCGRPICCHDSWGKGNSTIWGGYTCDSPPILLDSLLENMKTVNPDPNYILYTGDSPPHDIWDQSAEGNMNITEYVMQKIIEYFPNTSILYSIGNHEFYPASQDQLPPLDSWVFEDMVRIYGAYLPQEAQKTYSLFGYYLLNLSSSLSFISINSQAFDKENFWLYDEQNLDTYDPGSQLLWLNMTLSQLQTEGRYVWISSHIPPGDPGSLDPYTSRFFNIYQQYSDIIVANFHGHTHYDQFRLLYNNTGHLYGSQFIMSSLTPLGGRNPTFRQYYFDNNGTIVDYDQYWTNITYITENNTLLWQVEYRATEAYNITDLSLNNLQIIANKMKTNVTVLQEYCRFYKGSSLLNTCTDKETLRKTYCQVITNSEAQYKNCCSGVT